MRILEGLLCAGLVLQPALAIAQGVEPGTTGRVEFGARATDVSGDGARFERYRDLGDGLFWDVLRLDHRGDRWLTSLRGEHVGRIDQRFRFDANHPGRLKVWGMYDQIPMLLSDSTRTLFDDSNPSAGLQIDDVLQSQAQDDRTLLPVLFENNARTFELSTRRYIGEGGFEYMASSALTFRGTARHTNRDGRIPYGGSFGHGQSIELTAPVEHQLTDVEGHAEYVSGAVLVRTGFTGSWFRNDVTELTFDNPLAISDAVSRPSAGRLSLAPNSSHVGVNGLLSIALPRRSRFTAYGSVGSLTDGGQAIMAQTVNTALSPAPLERQFADGEARTSAVSLALTSRPTRMANVAIRYRVYKHDNRTPVFSVAERVQYDDRVREGESHTEPLSVQRQTFTADFNLTPASRMSVGVGAIGVIEDRTHRIFDRTTEYGTRLWFDSVGNSVATVRTKWEYSRKRTDVDAAAAAALLEEFGEQPGMRHYDVAERDRNRVTVLASMTPIDSLMLNVSLAAGKDDYIASEFGLRDNTHRVVTAGFDVMPSDTVMYGLSYSYEHYNALSRSRQANSSAEFADPSRNWATDGTDRVHSVILNVGAENIRDRFDLAFSYDFNRARATYEYITGPVPDRTLPEELSLASTLPDPEALPPTLSELQRGTADFTVHVNARLSIGLSYWFEKYRVEDFTLDSSSTTDLVRGSIILLGYLYRPYTANTAWGRVIYRF